MDYLCYKLQSVESLNPDLTTLTDEERAFPPLRRMARLLLKQEIARRTGQQPEDILFSYNEHGKPLLNDLHFNVSHSGEMICLAFHSDAIGVDIQKEAPRATIQRLAPKVMCEEQLQRFREQGEPLSLFFKAWCIMEALVKCEGTTVWNAAAYPFIIYPDHVKLLFPSSIVVELFTPAEGYYGAVAYKLLACPPQS